MAKSNKQWLRRHVTDPYVRKAREQGYRSRSAFKLLEIDDKEKLLRPGVIVVDLGAAPGGWSQVAAARVKPGGRVIAIDLLKIAPITGVEVVAGDFRAARLEGVRADIVLSDLAPNLSGVASVDQARAAGLVDTRDSREVRREVREHDVRPHTFQPRGAEISRHHLYPSDGGNLQQINGDDAPAGLDPGGGHLRPAARRGAQVHYDYPRPQKLLLVV